MSFLYTYTNNVIDTRDMINSISLNAQELIKQAQSGDNNAINQLCQGIYNATANKLGTDEDYINSIMQNADSKTLANIMNAYSDVTGSEIFKDIENDFSGKAEKEILATLENAYKEVNNEEYTGDNDGKLSIDQKAQSIGKGLLNKVPDIALTIGGVALAKSAIGACISGVATTALTAVFGTAAATVATIAAPVLAGVGLVAAGVMIYKGVTQTAQAIKDGQNATTDDIAQNALQDGTEGVITTGLGIYEGYESVKAIGDIAKANNANKQYQQEINTEVQVRIEQEQLATQRVQQAQAEYNKPFEDALSNKSAQKSAEVIKAKLDIEYEIDKQGLREQLRGDRFSCDLPAQHTYTLNKNGLPIPNGPTVNDLIRNVDDISELPDYIRMQIELADENWSNIKPFQHDTCLYRGETPYKGQNGWEHYNYIKNIQPGEIIIDKGYMYASPCEISDAYRSGGTYMLNGNECIQYEIRVPRGAKIENCIREYIFPRNSQFKILSNNVTEDGIVTILMEYILPN